jgi:CRP/FNR family transcriptional regulator, cyclic AMP receptor protein
MTTMFAPITQLRKTVESKKSPTCTTCSQPNHNFFCDLAGHELRIFESLKLTRHYPKEKVLFVEGQPAMGVYILCRGTVKLSTCSPDGKVIILNIAEPGEVLGLSAVLADIEYGLTAEVLEPCQVNYVRKDDFITYLRQNPEAALNAARQLASSCHRAQRMICSFGLSDSVIVKLAKLFLSWSVKADGNNGTMKLKNSFTHLDMAGMIGSTRETVTRALRDLRERGLVTLKGSDLLIHDMDGLRRTAGVRSSGCRSLYEVSNSETYYM